MLNYENEEEQFEPEVENDDEFEELESEEFEDDEFEDDEDEE